jgi:hypothetical protein
LFFSVLAWTCGARAEDTVVLPRYDVSAAVIAKMMPRQQLADISREAAESSTFRFSEVVMAKAPYSKFSSAVKCLVRDKDGRIVKDITNDNLTVAIEPTWADGFLSSNQPAEYSVFSVLLRPQFEGRTVTAGYCQRLLLEYVKFSSARIDRAAKHYGAGRLSFGNLVWFTTPDEVLIVFKSSNACEQVARVAGGRVDGARLHSVSRNSIIWSLRMGERGPWQRLTRSTASLPGVRSDHLRKCATMPRCFRWAGSSIRRTGWTMASAI